MTQDGADSISPDWSALSGQLHTDQGYPAGRGRSVHRGRRWAARRGRSSRQTSDVPRGVRLVNGTCHAIVAGNG